MKRFLKIFELTPNEQRVVLIVVLALITIAFFGYERRVYHSPAQSNATIEPKPSSTPVETVGDE